MALSPKADDPFTCRGSDPRGRVGRSHDPNGVRVLPPPGPTLMVIEWVRQLGGRLLLFLVLTGINCAY